MKWEEAQELEKCVTTLAALLPRVDTGAPREAVSKTLKILRKLCRKVKKNMPEAYTWNKEDE